MDKVVFYEGFITNQKELSKELKLENYEITNSEMQEEILLAGYKKWSERLPLHLKGYFSFGIFDEEKKAFFGSRDRFGVIPFYYAYNQGRLACGYSINQIFEKINIKKELNTSALQKFLSFSYVPGEETFYKNIIKLLPGNNLIFNGNQIITKEYHSWDFNTIYEYSLEECAKILNDKVKESYDNKRCKEGSFFLSSGVDSNYLFAISDCKRAYTVGSDDGEFDESEKSCINAEKLGGTCESVTINSQLFFDSVKEVLVKMEQPVGTASTVAFWLGCKNASKNSQICFTGEGADELFAGYEIYKQAPFFNKKNTYLGKVHIFDENEKKGLLKNYLTNLHDKEIIDELCPRNEKIDNLSYMMSVDIKAWLEADSFMSTFKMSRANGLEIRMPFVDEDVFEFAFSIPSDYKIKDGINKFILRKAAESALPHDIAYYKKRGFVIPIRKWMNTSCFTDEFHKAIKCANNILNEDYVEECLKDFKCGNQRAWRKIWVLYSFAKWYEINFKEVFE